MSDGPETKKEESAKPSPVIAKKIFVFSNFKFKLLPKRLADHGWLYWLIHLLIAIIGAAIPVWIAALFLATSVQKPSDKIWTALAGQQESVPVIVSNFSQQNFNTGSGIAILPQNVPLVGIADALGASELVDALSHSHPQRTARLLVTEEVGQEHRQASFLTVGGPSVNKMTDNLVAKWKDQEQDPQQAYSFTKNVTLDGKLIIHYPDHYVEDYGEIDEKTKQAPKLYVLGIVNRRVTHDFGFIVIGPNPFDGSKTVCALYGIWPQGTQAAIRALTRPDTRNPLFTELLNRLEKHEGVVAVVETNVWSFTAESPRIIAVRKLDPNPVPADKFNKLPK